MTSKEIRYDLQNLISGESSASYDALIQAVASYLRSGKRAGPMAEEKHNYKSKERARLVDFAKRNDLIFDFIPEDKFIASGAEQKVYISGDKYVVKLNDTIYYASWEDYFNNLLLHNYFFADTAYNLLGFHISENVLYAVVQQRYIKADTITNLADVKEFMEVNGFVNTRRHDYKNIELGLIIEDLHDENVLTAGGILHFIDTVFFVDHVKFWKK